MQTVKCDQADDCDHLNCYHVQEHPECGTCRAKRCYYREMWLGRKPYTVRCVSVPDASEARQKGDEDDD